MGIALLSAARLVMAVPVWIDRLALDAGWSHARRRAGSMRRLWAGRASAPRPLPVNPSAASVRPLRVLRVVDAGQPAGSTGRMVISGRIADVCAELDRLAAAEDAATRR